MAHLLGCFLFEKKPASQAHQWSFCFLLYLGKGPDIKIGRSDLDTQEMPRLVGLKQRHPKGHTSGSWMTLKGKPEHPYTIHVCSFCLHVVDF